MDQTTAPGNSNYYGPKQLDDAILLTESLLNRWLQDDEGFGALLGFLVGPESQPLSLPEADPLWQQKVRDLHQALGASGWGLNWQIQFVDPLDADSGRGSAFTPDQGFELIVDAAVLNKSSSRQIVVDLLVALGAAINDYLYAGSGAALAIGERFAEKISALSDRSVFKSEDPCDDAVRPSSRLRTKSVQLLPMAMADAGDPVEPVFDQASLSSDPIRASQSSAVQSISYDTVLTDGDQGTDALIAGTRWGNGGASTPLTFSFPTQAANYESNYYDSTAISTVAELNSAQKTATRKVFAGYASISNLTYTELGVTVGVVSNADLRLARSAAPGTAYCYYPTSNPVGGDSFYGSGSTSYDNPVVGNYAYHTFLHENGHALGLKHGQETTGPGAIPYSYDSMEYSVMTYRGYVGATLAIGYTNETWGYAQSLMMLDIAATQRLYGANYATNAGDTTYSFSTTSGALIVNGSVFETPGANRVFRTLWDGAGTDTYDFSNYSTNLSVDLAPGAYCDLDVGGSFQRSVLQSYATGTYQLSNGSLINLVYTRARGHVFNALLANGNLSSLIENGNGGAGNDTFRGNQAANTFRGNGGNDIFIDSDGSDTYYGGAASDAVYFASSIDLYSISYSASTSFLSVGFQGSVGLDLIYKDTESVYFNNIAYSFASLGDLVAPILVSSTPSDNASSVPVASAITLNFSEAVVAGVGNIILTNGSDVRSIAIGDASQVLFAGGAVTIQPAMGLAANSTYSVQLAAGVIKDLVGNDYAGISDTTTLNFATAALPQLAIAATDAVKAEGDSGGTVYTFTVNRSGDLSGGSSASWVVAGSGANQASADDFVGGLFPSGTVTFTAGESSKTITVSVNGDGSVEQDEGFTVSLASASNATISAASANGTISNDDVIPYPELAIAATDAVKAEGDSGSTVYSFTVNRSGDLSGGSSASWVVAGSGTNQASADDFVGGLFPSGTVTFAAGESSKTIIVSVSGDNSVEGDEGFTVTLSNASDATISAASANGTISNDEVLPSPELAIAATDAVKAEGDSGSTVYTFTVNRSGDLSGGSSASWVVAGSGANQASADDFVGGLFPSGTVTFAAGESSKTITVSVNGDGSVEQDEGFTVSLSNANDATISTASANGTISNDDVTAPIVTQVTTGTTDGNLAVGESVIFSVIFSDVVNVLGNPVLNLANGGSAPYLSGSGTAALAFAYVVTAADSSSSDLSTASSNALDLNGGSVKNIVAVAADLSGANSVNPSGDLAVDTSAPLVNSMAVNGNSLILSFSQPVVGNSLVASNFRWQIGAATAVVASGITLNAANNTVSLTFSGTAPSSSAAVKVSYAPTTGHADLGLIADSAGNPLTVFTDKVVDTYQSAATVTTLGDGGSTLPATSYADLVLTGGSAVNGNGNALANALTGNGATNILDGKAGVDRVDGLGAGDIYFVANSSDHTEAEFRDSGTTGTDEVRFASTTAGQTLKLFAGDTGLETVVIGTGTTANASTSATTALSVDASDVLNRLTITGNAGANILRGTGFGDTILGNGGVDSIAGQAGVDIITGGAGLDGLSGGADGDTFVYTTLADALVGGTSTARTFEKITDFQVGLDRIDAPGAAIRTVKVLGAVTALTDTAIGALLNASSSGSVNFAAGGASTFVFGSQTFLAINNNSASYSSTADAIVEVTGFGFFNGATTLANINIS